MIQSRAHEPQGRNPRNREKGKEQIAPTQRNEDTQIPSPWIWGPLSEPQVIRTGEEREATKPGDTPEQRPQPWTLGPPLEPRVIRREEEEQGPNPEPLKHLRRLQDQELVSHQLKTTTSVNKGE